MSRHARAAALAAGSCLAAAALAACRTAPVAHPESTAHSPAPLAAPASAEPTSPTTSRPDLPAAQEAPPPPQQPSEQPPPSPETSPSSSSSPPATPGQAGVPATASAALPPCVPPAPRVHHVHRRKKKEVPEGPEPPERPSPPKSDAVVDAQVGQEGTTLTSILGKDVKSPTGEDMGRVVDVLADADGHVRVAIIDFGGFLGVGTRRIAVDWPLLHFNPAAGDKWLILSVTRQKLQSTPEYKDPSSPRVLMPPPAPPDASNSGQAKK
jgi:hypothetical protein